MAMVFNSIICVYDAIDDCFAWLHGDHVEFTLAHTLFTPLSPTYPKHGGGGSGGGGMWCGLVVCYI